MEAATGSAGGGLGQSSDLHRSDGKKLTPSVALQRRTTATTVQPMNVDHQGPVCDWEEGVQTLALGKVPLGKVPLGKVPLGKGVGMEPCPEHVGLCRRGIA